MHLSRFWYYSDFVAYPVLIALLAAFGLVTVGWSGAAQWLTIFLGCVALWTLIEYAMHRFVLHHIPYAKAMHQSHHDHESASLGTPLWLSLFAHCALALMPIWVFVNFAEASAVSAGLMLGYLWYITVHHILHHWHPRHSGYLYRLKHRHAVHHHVDADCNFGVTTNFWDRIFRTALPKTERVPPHRSSARQG